MTSHETTNSTMQRRDKPTSARIIRGRLRNVSGRIPLLIPWLCACLCASMFVGACGARPPHQSATPSVAAVERFVAVLRNGGSLYGLGSGCDDWHAEPGAPEIDLTEAGGAGEVDDENAAEGVRPANDHSAPSKQDELQTAGPPPAPLTGRLTALADNAGRIYEFAYHLQLQDTSVRMRITGRGGWYPAPGVTIQSPDNGDSAVIGHANYCVTEVDVRRDPHIGDAVSVGEETWYLSRDACVRSRHDASPNAYRGCSKR
jgi:hypothetical protein